MPKQIITNTLSNQEKDILNLEEKYFKLLDNFFRDPFFEIGLHDIESYIQNSYSALHQWHVENKVALACERLVNLHIHKNFQGVMDIYPSPLSSDTAFYTKDAIINIDCKTYSIGTPGVTSGPGKGNKDDWKKATVGINQTSFDQKTHMVRGGSSIPVKFNLVKDDLHHNQKKPTLSFILGFLYMDDGKNFTWYRSLKEDLYKENTKFACIPNGYLSRLFNYEIIDNVKSYKYPEGMPSANRVSKNASGVLSFRIDHNILKKRVDSQGKNWDGFTSWQI